MKAVLTMNMPRNCGRCPLRQEHQLAFSQEVVVRCQFTGKVAEGVKIYGKRTIGKRPEWCPLRETPDIEVIMKKVVYDEEFADGWNACIDEIEGRRE